MRLESKPRVALLYKCNELVIPLKKGQEREITAFMDGLKLDIEKDVEIEIRNKRQKRSLDANAYMWVLCDKIAAVVRAAKEEVYRRAIKEVGVMSTILVTDKAVPATIEHWCKSGLGNFAEVMHKSKKVEGCSVVAVYYGSSTYDTAEMSRLIDWIVEEAQGLGISTMTPAEIERLKSQWT